jgi:hypothetical protein
MKAENDFVSHLRFSCSDREEYCPHCCDAMYLFVCSLFHDAVSNSDSIKLNINLEIMKKEVVMA